MITVFQGESKFIQFEVPVEYEGNAGVVDIYTDKETFITLSGVIASGYLGILTDTMSGYAPGYYTCIPYVQTTSGYIIVTGTENLEIVGRVR